MSRRRAPSNPISLFPFLAVLMSAMGALILLLIVVSREAQRTRDLRHQQSQESHAVPLPPLPERREYPEVPPAKPIEVPELVQRPLSPLPSIEDPRDDLRAERRQVSAEIDSARAERSPVVDQAPLIAERDQWARRIEELTRQRTDLETNRKKIEATNEELGRSVAELEREKDRVDRQAKLARDRYSIVPYFGPNGTTRPPIYLECFRDRIVLQPEGIAIRASELPEPSVDNALAQVVTIVSHMMQNEQHRSPYPLLVVRPEGVVAFNFAKATLGELGTDYGYELVPDEIELAWEEPNEKIRERVLAALEADRARNKWASRRPTVFQLGAPPLDRSLMPGGQGTLADGGGAKPATGPFATPSDPGELQDVARDLPPVAGVGRATPQGTPAGGPRTGSVGELARLSRPLVPPSLVRAGGGESASSNSADRTQQLTGQAASTAGNAQEESFWDQFDSLEPRSATSSAAQSTPDAFAGAGGTGTQASSTGSGSPGSGEPTLGEPINIQTTKERIVVVECRKSGVTLYPGETFVPFTADSSQADVERALAQHLARMRTSWGPAPAGQRWRTVVELNVRPDGLERYFELRLMMAGSGIEVRQRLLGWKDDLDFREFWGNGKPANSASRPLESTFRR